MKTSIIRRMLTCIVLSVICMSAVADSFTYNYRGVDFKVSTKGNDVKIVGFNKDAAKVVIPAHVEDGKGRSFDVTALDLFDEFGGYKTNVVAIEKGITKIEERCFYAFKGLQQVYLPSTIVSIGKNAFHKKHMPEFTMPASINKQDLAEGLAVYPRAVDVDPMADIDVKDYIDEPVVPTPSKPKKDVAKVTPGTSDVDFNIPTTSQHRDNTYCVIIANENYDQTANVSYANIDGRTFSQYCTSVLGVPRKQVHLSTDASYKEMKNQIAWMKMMANAAAKTGKDINFIVYYAGHGAPGADGSCYLLPVDGDPHNADDDGYALKDIYNSLSQLDNTSTLMIIDACYSGSDRDDVCLYDGSDRGLKRVRQEKVGGNVVVMSAASNTETSMAFNEKGHGLFTYHLLKKLKDTKGNVSYGDLQDYVYGEVVMEAANQGKSQTPTVTYSDKLADSWKNIKF